MFFILKKIISKLLIIFVFTELITLGWYYLDGSAFYNYNLSFKMASGVTFVYGLIYLIKLLGGEKIKKESYAIIKTKTRKQRIFYSIIFYSLIYGFIWGLLTD